MTKADEVLEILRAGIEDRRWGDVVPSAVQLATELHADRKPLRAAIDVLVIEGTIVRSGNTYLIAAVAQGPTASPEHHRRVVLITEFYATGVTAAGIRQLSDEDLHVLTAGTLEVDPYSLFRLAIESLRGPAADAVRSALGWRDATSSHLSRAARRAALADEIGVATGELGRLERIGAVELASHIEALASLYVDGYLRFTLDDEHPPTPSVIKAQLDDLTHRIRTLELGER